MIEPELPDTTNLSSNDRSALLRIFWKLKELPDPTIGPLADTDFENPELSAAWQTIRQHHLEMADQERLIGAWVTVVAREYMGED